MRAISVKALMLLGLGCVFMVSWNCHTENYDRLWVTACNETEPRFRTDIAFGETVVGDVTGQSFVLRNTSYQYRELVPMGEIEGPVSTEVRVLGFSSVDCDLADAPFRVDGPFPIELVTRNEPVDLTLQFAPITTGSWECSLEPEFILLDGPAWAGDNETVAGCALRVTGSAVAGPGPACAVQQPDAQRDYGQVPIGSSSDLILTIRNETPDVLTTNQFKYLLTDPSADCRVFTIDPADTTGVIGPGESRDIAVRFAPDAAESFACTRSLASLKEPADPADPYIANACPTTVTWQGSGVIGPPEWSTCAPGGTNDWHGITGVSGSEIYVAGNGGSVIASVGDCNWPASGTVFSDVNLRDIWAYSDGASTVAWAVGNIPPPPGMFGETGAILRMDGALWYKVDEGIFVTYGAVWGSAFDDVYFVGTGISTDFPNAKHWNGTAFDTLHISPMGMSEVSGVNGNAANDIWAVLRQQTFSVYHYDGSEWTNETQPWMNKPLHDVWTVAGSGYYHAYAVGEDGAIYHFDGTHWTDESIPGETRDFYGVWVSQTGQVFVVGEGSVIYRSDGNNNWTQQTPSNVQGDLMDVWGASDSDVYAVGTNGLILRYAPPGP